MKLISKIRHKLQTKVLLIIGIFSVILLSITGNTIKRIRVKMTYYKQNNLIEKVNSLVYQIEPLYSKLNTDSEKKEFSESKVGKRIFNENNNKNGFSFLIDSKGYFVFKSNKKDSTTNTEIMTLMKKETTPKHVEFKSTNSKKKLLLFYQYSKLIDSYIGIVVTKKDFMTDIRSSMIGLRIFIPLMFMMLFSGSLVIIRPIVKSIKIETKYAKKISEGNLTAKLNLYKKNEIGELANALRNMNSNLENIIKKTVESAKIITKVGSETDRVSNQLSLDAVRQKESSQKVSVSIEEISTSINDNLQNAKNAESIVNNASKKVQMSNNNVQKAAKALSDIAGKIAIINDIAFQTKILSLNASIEAANAGKHGKGFAVVANEIRNLAHKSETAANEIEELSISAKNIAQKTSLISQEIAPEIQKTVDCIQNITTESEEQRTSTNEVNKAVLSLNDAAAKNASTAKNMSKNASELAEQAKILQDLISFFKVN